LDATVPRPYLTQVNLCLYEDPEVANFGPHALLRPVFSLRCGIFSLIEKLIRAFPDAPLVLVLRPALEDLTRALYPTSRLGAAGGGDALRERPALHDRRRGASLPRGVSDRGVVHGQRSPLRREGGGEAGVACRPVPSCRRPGARL